jgi:hypothetical protein
MNMWNQHYESYNEGNEQDIEVKSISVSITSISSIAGIQKA